MAKPKRYKLRYLPLFWEDLSEAAAYIAFELQNPIAAERLVDAVEVRRFLYKARNIESLI